MDPLTHITFAWGQDAALASALFLVQLIMVATAIGVGVRTAGWGRRLGAAFFAAILVASPLAVQRATSWTLYGVQVEANGALTAYTGVFYRPVDVGFSPTFRMSYVNSGTSKRLCTLSIAQIPIPGEPGRFAEFHARNGLFALDDCMETYQATKRARARARLSSTWGGPIPTDKLADAVERIRARERLVGPMGLTAVEELVYTSPDFIDVCSWTLADRYDFGSEAMLPFVSDFRQLGARRIAALLDRAGAVFDGLPSDTVFRDLSAERKTDLSKVQEELTSCPDDLGALVEAYIDAHIHEIGQAVTTQ